MACKRELNCAYVKLVGGAGPPCFNGTSKAGARWLANLVRRFLEEAKIEASVLEITEYVNVCAECGQSFEFDRFGCCPNCTAPLGGE